ncbi:MAG TPA: signal peptidase II [Solirubrobacterales bacterium]|nr:signal peptidase II [Solirubrobacterales bacterium]
MSAAARAWALAGILCAVVVAADQAAKARVEATIFPGEEVDVLGPLKLTLAHNTGVAFGLAGGAGVGLILVTAAALALIGYLFARDPQRRGMWVAAGLLGGGAIGNLIDRVTSDAVTDFIDVGSWPPFNLADVAITAGVVLMVLIYLRDVESGAEGG